MSIDICALLSTLVYFAFYRKLQSLAELSSRNYGADNRRILYQMIPFALQHVIFCHSLQKVSVKPLIEMRSRECLVLTPIFEKFNFQSVIFHHLMIVEAYDQKQRYATRSKEYKHFFR